MLLGPEIGGDPLDDFLAGKALRLVAIERRDKALAVVCNVTLSSFEDIRGMDTTEGGSVTGETVGRLKEAGEGFEEATVIVDEFRRKDDRDGDLAILGRFDSERLS